MTISPTMIGLGVAGAVGVGAGIYAIAKFAGTNHEIDDAVYRERSNNGANTLTTGTQDSGQNGWIAKVDVNFHPDMDITGFSTPTGFQSHVAVRGSADFTDVQLSPTGRGGLIGAYHGFHTGTETYYDSEGKSHTRSVPVAHSATLSVTGDEDNWTAKADVPFGRDITFDGHTTPDGGHRIHVSRPGNDITVNGTGDASLAQQLTTAVALGIHN